MSYESSIIDVDIGNFEKVGCSHGDCHFLKLPCHKRENLCAHLLPLNSPAHVPCLNVSDPFTRWQVLSELAAVERSCVFVDVNAVSKSNVRHRAHGPPPNRFHDYEGSWWAIGEAGSQWAATLRQGFVGRRPLSRRLEDQSSKVFQVFARGSFQFIAYALSSQVLIRSTLLAYATKQLLYSLTCANHPLIVFARRSPAVVSTSISSIAEQSYLAKRPLYEQLRESYDLECAMPIVPAATTSR